MSQPPEWENLRAELSAVVSSAAAFNAYVFDVWSNFWCAAHSYAYVAEEELAELIRLIAKMKHVSLTRGAQLDTAYSNHVSRWHLYAKTYGSCYVLLLRFPGGFREAETRDAVAAALSRIEALTLLLPPPDGPGSDGGEAASSA